jgi:endoglucanase
MNHLLGLMKKYTDEGYGIVFGEYAVLTKNDGSLKNNTLEFTTNFLDNCDLYGYVPMLWDTNAFFKRDLLKIDDEGLAKLYFDRRLEAELTLSEEEHRTRTLQSMEKALAIAIENDKHTSGPSLKGDEHAVAWIMFSSADYALTYSVGDVYDPSLSSDGVVATDVLIEKSGTYTIALDFTNTANGYAESIAFSAIGISNGELLFPGYIITLKEVLINGSPYKLKGIPYTTADDDICTRLNLYNGWVSKVDVATARFNNPNMASFLSPTVLEPQELHQIETISITFEYTP